MKGDTVVEAGFGEAEEVVDGFGGVFRVEFEAERSRAQSGEELDVGFGFDPARFQQVLFFGEESAVGRGVRRETGRGQRGGGQT